jgi:hypothetical protein
LQDDKILQTSSSVGIGAYGHIMLVDDDEDELFQKYIKEGVIDSTIEKPVTLIRLCQRVREEFLKYELAIQKGIS